jgi:nucleotide-binding universal stress UspA family protein
VDLLIIGALQKENLLTFYIGSLARSISRKAKCSVLLLTTPHVNASKPRKIIVNGVENPKTIHTINTALYFAESYDIREITVVKEVHTPALAMTIADESTAPEAKELKKSLSAEEEEKLHSVIEQCKTDKVKITEKTIKGKPGYAISKYARDKKADLLVINSPDTNLTLLDRIFTHDIEYILADLPCNVLIVHSRV